MTNGDRLIFMKNVFLPASIRSTNNRSDRSLFCQSHKTKQTKAATVQPPSTADDESDATTATKNADNDWSPIWQFLPSGEKNQKTKSTYNVIIVMLCVGLGFLIFMIVTMRMLFNIFKFKQGDGGSSSKRRKRAEKAERANKKPRRTSSVTSRRLSRVSSIMSIRSR